MKKATPEEKAAADLLNKALEEEENAALQNVSESTPVVEAPSDAAGNTANATAPVTDAPKRRRGRPTDAERALRESVDAPSGGADSGTGSAGAKRGPKPKSKGSDSGALAKSLVGIHQLVAMVTGIQEAQLSDGEGQALAEGVVAVCEEYGLSINGKTGAAMQLFGACAMIYGPRLFYFKARMAQERAKAEQNAQALTPTNY